MDTSLLTYYNVNVHLKEDVNIEYVILKIGLYVRVTNGNCLFGKFYRIIGLILITEVLLEQKLFYKKERQK